MKEEILAAYVTTLQNHNISGDLDSRLYAQLRETGLQLLKQMYEEGRKDPLCNNKEENNGKKAD